jgi:hypothetical protein
MNNSLSQSLHFGELHGLNRGLSRLKSFEFIGNVLRTRVQGWRPLLSSTQEFVQPPKSTRHPAPERLVTATQLQSGVFDGVMKLFINQFPASLLISRLLSILQECPWI